MSILTTSNSTQPDPLAIQIKVPELRTSAASASGFAQVLQTFDRDEDPGTIESSKKDDSVVASEEESVEARAEAGEDEATEADEPEQASTNDASQEQGGHSGQSQGAVDEGKSAKSTDGASDADVSHPPSSETEGQAANKDAMTQAAKQEPGGFDALNNKSDQAKLSIRGLVRAIRADASQDSTTIAVQTRLGKAPANDQAAQTPPSPQPEANTQAVHTEKTPQLKGSDPRDAISDTPPISDRGEVESKRTPSVPGAYLTPAKDAPAEQARVDTTQVRSSRADVSVQPTTTRSTEPVRTEAHHSVARAETLSRVEGALTTRAVSGVEAAQTRVGADQSNARLEQSLKPMKSEQQALQSKVIAQVQRGLASLMRSTNGEMTLRLTPQRLGELKIELKRSGEQLSVRLTTQNAEARDLLSSGTDELTQLLRAKGVDVERVQIEHQNEHTQGQGAFDLDQHEHRDQTREQGNASHQPNPISGEAVDSISDEDSQRDGIWTELGLDAIA